MQEVCAHEHHLLDDVEIGPCVMADQDVKIRWQACHVAPIQMLLNSTVDGNIAQFGNAPQIRCHTLQQVVGILGKDT